MADDISADFIVLGAGSAGSVLANRLSADGRAQVLVLEAGGSDLNFWVQMPIGYGKAYYDGRINWKYTTLPVEGLGGRTSYWPRGKVMGGSSSINAMVYARGLPTDFDDWAAAAPGWGWRDVEPVFRRMEDWDGPENPLRGRGGPLHVSDIRGEVHPMCQTYLEAARQAQLPVVEDYNVAGAEGASIYQITTKGGRRASASRCYLRPALKRGNARLETRAHATRILFDGRRAIGVEYRQGGETRRALARREVILSAGAVNSPQLLQLSGVGPAAHLRAKGVEVVLDSPHVGANMQDHIGIDAHYVSRVPTLNQVLRPWIGRMLVGMQWLLTRRGPLSLSINQGGGFVRSRPGLDRPDIQLYFSPVSYTRAPAGKRPMMSPDPFPGFLIGASPCRPTSEGWVRIASADPFVQPEIQPNYFTAEGDRQLMLDSLRLIRRIAAAPAFAEITEREISPGPDKTSDDALWEFVRAAAWTVFHPCCTCRMGSDPAASVLDPQLRVRGIDGLRVADASAFPNVTSGNINAPVIMLAEKAAEIILSGR